MLHTLALQGRMAEMVATNSIKTPSPSPSPGTCRSWRKRLKAERAEMMEKTRVAIKRLLVFFTPPAMARLPEMMKWTKEPTLIKP